MNKNSIASSSWPRWARWCRPSRPCANRRRPRRSRHAAPHGAQRRQRRAARQHPDAERRRCLAQHLSPVRRRSSKARSSTTRAATRGSATSSARVILNEVNSSKPSQLRGYVEVAGPRAQVVVANPAGIHCEGCGFINANRTTLTTGTPMLNGGSLDAYLVQRGTISIGGAGMDASSSDYTELIARAVQINAGLWARQLAVTTGTRRSAPITRKRPRSPRPQAWPRAGLRDRRGRARRHVRRQDRVWSAPKPASACAMPATSARAPAR